MSAIMEKVQYVCGMSLCMRRFYGAICMWSVIVYA